MKTKKRVRYGSMAVFFTLTLLLSLTALAEIEPVLADETLNDAVEIDVGECELCSAIETDTPGWELYIDPVEPPDIWPIVKGFFDNELKYESPVFKRGNTAWLVILKPLGSTAVVGATDANGKNL